MAVQAFAGAFIRKSLVVLTCVALVSGGAPGLFAQESIATFAGVILDPAGKPAFGFKVVLTDVATGIKYTSPPTDAAGNYTLKVPVGGRYKLESVVADDGVTKLAVQDVAPISVLEAGTSSLNVRFTNTPVAGGQASGATTATDEEEKKKKKGAVPWYKRPGPIVGMVLGGAALAAIAISAGGDDNNDNSASRSMPSPKD